MSRWLRQSTAQTERIGPFLDATTGVDEETALSPVTELSKDGGAFATGPTGTHDAEGWYSIALTTTHTNTVGSLVIKAQDSANHLPVWHEFMVIPANVYDSLVLGTDTLETDTTQWLGTAAATPTVAGVPEVDVTHWIGTAAATPTVAGVPEVDVTHMEGGTQTVTDLKDFADEGYDPATNKVQGVVLADSLTSVATGGIVAGSFAAGAIDAAAIANSAIDAATFAAGAIDATAIATDAIDDDAIATGAIASTAFAAGAIDAAAIATGAIDADALAADASTEIRSVVSGTATGGSTTTLVDTARTEADTDYWVGSVLLMTSGNIAGQARRITAFVPGTDTITVDTAFTQAVVAQTYEILATTYAEAPAAGSGDWTSGEKENIRDALGVDGTKTAATGGQLQVVDSNVDLILADTADMQPKLGTPAADISADIAAVKTEADKIALTDAGAGVTGSVIEEVENVLADTADMQPKLGTPAADISADIAAVKVDTAAVLVDTGTDGVVLAANSVDSTAIATDAIDADALAADAVAEIRSVVSGTADSGTTTTLVDAVRTEADTDYWKGSVLLITSGTISGQARRITAFTPGTDTITVDTAFTQAVGTNTYEILATTYAEAPAAGSGDWSTAEKEQIRDSLGVDGTKTTATGGQLQTIDTNVDSILADTGTDGVVIATGAITAAVIATDAIDADALATDAVDEIVDGVWDEPLSGHTTGGTAGKALSNAANVVLADGTSDNVPANTSTTISLENTESAVDDFYNHQAIVIAGGTGIGQVRIISDYDGTNRSATITPAWDTTPDATSDYIIYPAVAHTETQAPGYLEGAVWISSAGAIPTTAQQFVDGVADNPLDDSAFDSGAARTLADSLNLTNYRFENGSSITLDQSYSNRTLTGNRWTCAFGGQAVDNSFFENCTLSGTAVANTTPFRVKNVLLGTCSLPGCGVEGASVAGTVTFTSGGGSDKWAFRNCSSDVAGGTAPIYDFGAGTTENAASVYFRNYSGGIDIRQLGVGNASDAISIEGNGQVIVNANCTGGTIVIRGNFSLTDNSGGAVTITQDARYNTSQATGSISTGGITASTFAAGAIDATAIATDAIDADAIADNAIDAAAIATDAITAAKVADGTIDAATFAAGAIDSTAIAAGAIDASAIATDAIDADALATDAVNEIADGYLDRTNGIETGLTPRQAQRLIASATAGKLSGAATTTVVIRNAVADAVDRITATVDADGNRSAITYNLS